MSVLKSVHSAHKPVHKGKLQDDCSLRKAEVARSNRVISTTFGCIFNTLSGIKGTKSCSNPNPTK